MKTRAEALRSIEEQSFDVCVIGGGATGSGCALDAQLRGLKTVQLEAGDFGSATSSASTKMAHGGVRYLEQAIRNFDLTEYRLVRRALRERMYMLRNAPFLTRAMEFITPCFRWRDVVYLWIGLKLYDWIAGSAGLGRSHYVSRDQALRRLGGISDGLVGAVTYMDGQFDDARYSLALVNSFADAGGEALNYARVAGFEKDAGGKLQCATVEILDGLGSDGRPATRKMTVRARAFINATGISSDTIRRMATSDVALRMRASKGVHILLLPLEVLPGRDAMLIPKTDDGRVLFAIPYQGRILVGTTDDEIKIGEELYLEQKEADYLLRHLNRYLSSPVSREKIVSGTAGARPLVNSQKRSETKELVREHEVEFDAASGLISILGGKWTTYRAMAEETIDAAQRYLGSAVTPCPTKDYRLAGSRGYTTAYARDLQTRFGLSEDGARHLAGKFGDRAADVLALAAGDADLALPLIEGLAPLRAEVIYCARHEMAITVEDILSRRIGLELYGWREAIEAAPIVANLLARELGWPAEAEQVAVSQYVGKIRSQMTRAGLVPV